MSEEEDKPDRTLTVTAYEETKRSKRKRETTKKLPVWKVNSAEFLRNCLENPENFKTPCTIQISRVFPSEVLAILKKNQLSSQFQGIQLVFHGSFFESCEKVNELMSFLAEKSANSLEILGLTCFDVKKDVNSLDFSVFSRFKTLQGLKIDLSFNELSRKSQENVLFAFITLEKLRSISLGLGNCGLKDEFFAMLSEISEKSSSFLSNLLKIKLNLSGNPFEFKGNLGLSDINGEKTLAKLRTLSVNLAFCNKIDGFFSKVNEKLSKSLDSLRKLCDLNLNLYYCGLSHENIEDLCENLVKRNENLNISLDLREAPDKQIAIKTIKAIEGMIALFRGKANPQKCRVFY